MGTDHEGQGQGQEDEYAKPTIVDHGDLQELTASGGGAITDVPMGNPNSSTCAP